jgi:hypothetical protein
MSAISHQSCIHEMIETGQFGQQKQERKKNAEKF